MIGMTWIERREGLHPVAPRRAKHATMNVGCAETASGFALLYGSLFAAPRPQTACAHAHGFRIRTGKNALAHRPTDARRCKTYATRRAPRTIRAHFKEFVRLTPSKHRFFCK